MKIVEILGQSNEVADYSLGTGFRNPVELTSSLLRTIAVPADEDYGRIAVDFSPKGPITQEAISKAFEGQQFIFALHISRSDFERGDQENKSYDTSVWRPLKKEWITDVLKDSDGVYCQKLFPH